ncbi:CbtA family protein [Azospirillum canadense]|uniref:CbtA family protein n=1 Tax=Azospirillum canadense TaxID=403962 RepID=UPI002227B148|nr:CbtA family protein [Azospirillum canadense]MCW2243890.1 cobalt transporter subunit CbtA [Azospirillum canadense]
MTLFRRLFLAAVVAGVLSGTAASVVQQVTTVPLILEAERYETVPAPVAAPAATAEHAQSPAGHVHAAPAPAEEVTAAEAFQRVGLTVVANLLVGVAYGLLLAGTMLLVGAPVDARRGLVWGIGGFVAFALAPAVGLPPELPGMGGAELEARQAWWIAAALCAAGGLLALGFAKNRFVIAVGVVLAALPHVIGAPHPESPEGVVPPEMAARFAVLSIGVAALFWAALGSACGALMQRVVEARR